MGTSIDREVAWVPGAALAMRRELWQELGPLDESFRLYAQDLDLCVRARRAGWAVRVLAAFRVRHHQGATVQTVLGASAPHLAALFWPALLLGRATMRGPRYARRAGIAVRAGARLRLIGRRMWTPTIPIHHRHTWEKGNNEIRTALAALREAELHDRM
jgi:hypothetical protein